MRNRIIITLGIIGILLLYLLISGMKKSADLPDLESWEGKPGEIVISRGAKAPLRIYRKDDAWLIGEAAYPADKAVMSNLEKKMKDLELTDLISRKPHYERYELDPEMAVRVTVKAGTRVLRDVFIGKKSPTYRQSYVRLSGRPEVYLASGTLADDLNKPLDDFREKEVFRAVRDTIESIEIVFKGRKMTLEKVLEEKRDGDSAAEGKKEEKDKKVEKYTRWVCREAKNVRLDDNKVNALLSSFDPVQADAFPEADRKALRAPMCTLRIRLEKKSMDLAIYNNQKKGEAGRERGRYICASSESPYLFSMDDSRAERYMKTVEDLKETN